MLALAGAGAIAPLAAADNPIVTENEQPGTTAWQITQTAYDNVGQIKGYASAPSVNKGENITFYVSVNLAQTYTIDVFRIGWYQGLGGRLMQHIGPLDGTQQPACPEDSTTGMIACNWAPAYTLSTQTTWTSGIYLALLTNAQGWQNYIEFVVRDDSRTAALLYVQPVTTYEAYNDYPNDGVTGKSLYEFNSNGPNTVAGDARAVKVSFDRPYADNGTGANGQSFLTREINFVRWMERSGYDVTYSTDIDVDLNPGQLLNYRGVLSVGHDEYWSKAMFDAFTAARDSGVNLGFFGADTICSQVRFEPSSTGVPDRVMVYYGDASLDPETDPSLLTIDWRSLPEPRPEQALVGVQFTNQVQNNVNVPYVVTNSDNWVYAGTGFNDGDAVPGIVGYEADRLFSNFAQPPAVGGSYTVLSHSPFIDSGTDTPDYANSSVYQASSGAWVFATGTIDWGWALDNFGDRNLVDSRIQQTTANVLNRFVGPDFTLAASPLSQSVTQGGATNYAVSVMPAGGFSGQVQLSVSNLPAGVSASFSPSPTTSSSTLNVSAGPSTPTGTYTLTITGVGGGLTHTASVALVVNPSTPPTSTASSPTVTNTTTWNVSYTASAGGSGVAEVDLYAQAPGQTGYTKVASNISGAATGSFSYTATAGAGSYSFYTIATDNAGNAQATPTSPQTTTLLDTTPPASTASSPASSTSTSWNVSYTASDNTGGSGVAEVDLYAQAPGQTGYTKVASNISGAATGSFSYTATAGEGSYSFYTIATDNAGNAQATPSSPQTTTLLDTTPPASAASSPASSTSTSWSVTYTASDNTGGSGARRSRPLRPGARPNRLHQGRLQHQRRRHRQL